MKIKDANIDDDELWSFLKIKIEIEI